MHTARGVMIYICARHLPGTSAHGCRRRFRTSMERHTTFSAFRQDGTVPVAVRETAPDLADLCACCNDTVPRAEEARGVSPNRSLAAEWNRLPATRSASEDGRRSVPDTTGQQSV